MFLNFLVTFKHSLSFTSLFITFTCAISFWGKFIIKLFKLKKEDKYGSPLSISIGACLIIYISYILRPYITNYRFILTLFYYTGVIGCIIDLILINGYKLLKINKISLLLKKIWINNYLIVSSLFISCIISLVYLILSTANILEVWWLSSPDYYNWVLICDYWVGTINSTAFNFNELFNYIKYDSFGTHIIFCLFTIANGTTALQAGLPFMLIILVWISIIIANIIKKIFKLNIILSFAVGLSVISTSFFNYIISCGLIGQFIGTMAFLISIEQIYSSKITNIFKKQHLIKIFFPLFLIFISYQGGYLIFFIIISICSIILNLFQSHQTYRIKIKFGIYRFLQILILLLIGGLLLPIEIYSLIRRTFEVINQTEGWSLSLINPLLFSGFPIYSENNYINMIKVNKLIYIPFIIFINFMVILINNKVLNKSQRPAFLSISYLYQLSILMYIFSYYIIGDTYQTWKLASFTCLPLSFVPIGLIILSIKVIRAKIFQVVVYSIIIFLIPYITFNLLSIKPISTVYKRVFGVDNVRSYYNIISKIISKEPSNTKFFFFIEEDSKQLLANELFKIDHTKKSLSLIPNFVINSSLNDLLIAYQSNEQIKIISDRDYDNIFMANKGSITKNQLFVYDLTWLKQHGYVYYRGVDVKNDWSTFRNWFSIKIIIPEQIKSQDAIFKLFLVKNNKNNNNCSNVRVIVHGKEKLIDSKYNIENITADIPAFATQNGLIHISILANNVQKLNSKDLLCKYIVEDVQLFAKNK
jgi:hypothetical protein